ncbi:MAG: KpsF/GutQ family sugar-phosphate isomerase [Proteobacteria bacterium]|nr:KpsF/GutQ family sugar-phosphate isomerase [Pseudomonadota bacterium]
MTLKPVPKAPASNPLEDARAVLRTEIKALQALDSALNGSFLKAVEITHACEGRVVVTGIGKSGHVARKVTATLASTGTPSMFVHPAEASHGDLGMVTRQDCVLALSNSGEAAELADIVAYTRRFSIPLIAMTSRANSTLGAQADCVLELPQAEEACPLGLAPTSSTTMMMALGDALAIALLHKRGFTASDYKSLHPGGKLGKKLLLVRELMHKGAAVPLANEDTAMSEIILTMTQKTFGCCGILDKNQGLIGIITDGDLRRHMSAGLFNMRAQEVMTKNPKTIGPDKLAAEALGRMNEKKVTSLFVIDEAQKVLGIIRMHDLLKEGVG